MCKGQWDLYLPTPSGPLWNTISAAHEAIFLPQLRALSRPLPAHMRFPHSQGLSPQTCHVCIWGQFSSIDFKFRMRLDSGMAWDKFPFLLLGCFVSSSSARTQP